MAQCARCFAPKSDLKPYRLDPRMDVCKGCTYELDKAVGFLEYHGWVCMNAAELKKIVKSVEERVRKEVLLGLHGQAELTPPTPPGNGSGEDETLTEAAEGPPPEVPEPEPLPSPGKARKHH